MSDRSDPPGSGGYGSPDPGEVGASAEAVIRAFEQVGVVAVALEGPDLRVAAWNRLARLAMQPAVAGLGAALLGSQWLRGAGFEQQVLAVARIGEPLTLPEAAFPPSSGVEESEDGVYDVQIVPWRWPDGDVRGLLLVAVDVAEQVRRRQAAEADAAGWRERFETGRDGMTALQSALLPEGVPVLPEVRLGARYLVAQPDTAAGGDWFSALPLGAGRVAVVVGDVVGHGVVASATMGQLRAVLEERLRAGVGVAAAVEAVAVFAGHTPAARAATVCVAVVDPSTGVVEYCTAGHPPPLLVHGQQWRYLKPTGGLPLGNGGDRPVAHVALPQEGLLLLYTDGLVQRPGRAWEQSTVEIGEVVTRTLSRSPTQPGGPRSTVELVCEQALHQLTRQTGVGDDVTVLAARRVIAPAPLQLDLPTGDGTAKAVAGDLDRWLVSVDASDDDRIGLRHAAAELVTNSVEHSTRTRPAGVVRVRLDAHLDPDGTAVVVVADTGAWVDPGRSPLTDFSQTEDGRFRGLGLPLAADLVDGFVLTPGPTGTTATLRRRLRRPAPLLTGPDTAVAANALFDEDEFAAYTPPDRQGTVVVHGPVTTNTAEALRDVVQMESRAGTQPLTLDLNLVTHLSSAGVHLIQQAMAEAQGHGNELTLLARARTPAHQILQLVGLPLYQADDPSAP